MTDAPYAVIRTTENTQAELLFMSYLLHEQDTACERCGRIQSRSEIMEVHVHPTRNIRRLRPAERIDDTKQIGLVTLDDRFVPICHECYTTLPQRVIGNFFASESAWRETVRRKSQPPPAPTIPAAAPRQKSYVDLNDI